MITKNSMQLKVLIKKVAVEKNIPAQLFEIQKKVRTNKIQLNSYYSCCPKASHNRLR